MRDRDRRLCLRIAGALAAVFGGIWVMGALRSPIGIVRQRPHSLVRQEIEADADDRSLDPPAVGAPRVDGDVASPADSARDFPAGEDTMPAQITCELRSPDFIDRRKNPDTEVRFFAERSRLLRDLGLDAPQTDRGVREQRAATAITAHFGIPLDDGRSALLDAIDLHVRFQFAAEDGDEPLAQALRDRATTVLAGAYGFDVSAKQAFSRSTRGRPAMSIRMAPSDDENR